MGQGRGRGRLRPDRVGRKAGMVQRKISGMNGNSWGAVGQWWAAAQNPRTSRRSLRGKALQMYTTRLYAAAAYRIQASRNYALSLMTGHGYAENASDMLEKYPLASHPYWKSKDGSGGKNNSSGLYRRQLCQHAAYARHVRRIPEDWVERKMAARCTIRTNGRTSMNIRKT